MATIAKRKVRLEIEWTKDDPSNLKWRTIGWGYLSDDSKPGGEEEIICVSDEETIERTQFRGLTGQQIETAASNTMDGAFQGLGSGAGGHIIQADTGD